MEKPGMLDAGIEGWLLSIAIGAALLIALYAREWIRDKLTNRKKSQL